MKKLLQHFSFLLVFGLACQQAHAALSLELTQGVDRAVPVAVVPFGGSAPVNMASIIGSDLANSGQFNVLADSKMKRHPNNPTTVDYRYWSKANIDNLIIGNVKSVGGGKYQVDVQLLDVFRGNSLQTAPKLENTANKSSDKAILINKRFTVTSKQLRRLAHHISDIIYQKLTGEQGIFSTRIAYVVVKRNPSQPSKATYSLEVADYDGYNPHALLVSNAPIMSPAWSPNGSEIAYVSFENKRAAIYMVNVSTGRRTKLMSYPGINGAPAFSPDGTRLAVVLSKDGSPHIYLYVLESKALTQVTHGNSIDTEPSWSKSGNSIIFTSDRGGSPQIYRVSLASGSVKRVTFNGNYNARASYAPNGKSIVMLHRNGGLFNIATQNLQTGTVRILTQSGLDESPSFAPNGRMIIFGSQYAGRGVLGEVSTDGRVKLRLPARQGNVQEPVWGPFIKTS